MKIYRSKIGHGLALLIFILLLFLSCQKLPNDVKRALKHAGENRKELQAVIDNYQKPEDSLKLKAAYFLIGNMVDKYFFSEDYLSMFDTVMTLADKIFDATEDNKDINIYYDKYNKTRDLFDSIYNSAFLLSRPEKKIIRDIYYVKADLLIENIDMSFYVWGNMPWAKFLTFDQFCDYILPYKSKNEKPEKWRKILFDKYKWVVDSVKNKTDPVEACFIANSELKTWFKPKWFFERYPTSIKFSDLMKIKGGECRDMTNMGLLVMRSIGIPVAKIYSPQDGNRSSGLHS